MILYLAPHDGKLWIVGSRETLPLVGTYILQLLEQGKDEAAYQWLDWATKGQGLLGINTFWGSVERDRETAKLAALILVSGDPDNVAALDALETALTKLEGQPRYHLTRTLLEAELPENRIGTLVEDFYRAQPDDALAQIIYSQYLFHLGDYATLEREAKNWGPLGEEVQNELLLSRDGYAGRASLIAEKAQKGKATAGDYNDLAWEALWEPAPPADLEDLLAKLDLTEHTQAHTSATHRAEQGKLLQAITQLKGSKGGRWAPAPVDRLVLGKIAEKLGDHESAISNYAKLEKSWKQVKHSSYALAKKWLAALEQPARAPADENPAAQ